MLAYYALLFGFGILYSECDDPAQGFGKSWRSTLPVSLLVLLAAAMEFATGTIGLRDTLLPTTYNRAVSVGLQAPYAWMMSFACLGMARSLLPSESKSIRYLSGASYWFYRERTCTW